MERLASPLIEPNIPRCGSEFIEANNPGCGEVAPSGAVKGSLAHISARVLFVAAGTAIALLAAAIVLAAPAFADASSPTLSSVIDNLRNWLMGILATVATLFLTIGGLRYIMAGSDPAGIERAKGTLRTALGGYALAVLAPLVIQILKSIVGG